MMPTLSLLLCLPIITTILLLICGAKPGHSFSISSVLFGTEEDNKDPDRPLTCYRGIKYFIGQEEIDDNVKCERNMLERTAGMDKYCYKFTSQSAAGTDFVKRGCSVMICTPLGKGCTKMEFEGVQGEMCCCSDTSYCNGGTAPTPASLAPAALLLLLLFILIVFPFI